MKENHIFSRDLNNFIFDECMSQEWMQGWSPCMLKDDWSRHSTRTHFLSISLNEGKIATSNDFWLKLA